MQELISDVSKKYRWQKQALHTLKSVTKAYLIDLFIETNLAATLCCITITDKDIRLVKKIREEIF